MAVLALIVLIAAMLFSKRRREAAAAAVPITGMAADSFEPTYLGEPSLIATPIVGASEANAKSQEANTSRPSATPAAATQPAPVPEFHLDPEFAFDDELVKGAERFSAYSTLEREHPGIVAKLTDTWGKPEAVANLQDYLMTPRQGGRPLSRDAMSELKMLQAVASDKSSEESGTIPWQPGRPKPRRV